MSQLKINPLLLIFYSLNVILFFVFVFTKQYLYFCVAIHLLSWLFLLLYLYRRLKIKKYIVLLKTEWAIAFLLFIAAFIIRTYSIDSVTPGMYGDEVAVGIQSLKLLHNTQLPPFLGDYSHPTPLLYLTALSQQLLGQTITAIRLPYILFGALSVGAFYFLLSMYIPRLYSIFGAVVFATQYIHIVLSRLAYEAIVSLFFQIVAVIAFVYYYKYLKKEYLLLIAIPLALGLYTYLNFRIFTFSLVCLVLFVIYKKVRKEFFYHSAIFFVTLFALTTPLLSYIFIEPTGFFGRTNELFLFNHTNNISNELIANVVRTLILPFFGQSGLNPPFIGDPNPGKNPAGMTFFDPITTVMAIIGIFFLFYNKKSSVFVLGYFYITALFNDIFTLERIPDFHYFGLGHPNTLRVSGIIPIIIFLFTYGIYSVSQMIKEKFRREQIYKVGIIITVGIISCLNIYWYFGQEKINRKNYLYNYKVNNADLMQTISFLNQVQPKKLGITIEMVSKVDYFTLFLNRSTHIAVLDLDTPQKVLDTLAEEFLLVIEVNRKTVDMLNVLIQPEVMSRYGYKAEEIKGIVEQPDFIIFVKE